MGTLAINLAGNYIEFQDAVYLVTEKLNPDGPIAIACRKDLDNITPHAELAALKGNIIALIADMHQLAQDGLSRRLLSLVQGQNHFMVAFRRAQAIDAGYACHHDNIPPLKQGTGRGMAQLIYFIVDGRILLDIGVR